MNYKEFNTALEEMMVKIDVRKQEYVGPHGLIEGNNDARYWRLDGILEGLKMAWHLANTTKDQKNILEDLDNE